MAVFITFILAGLWHGAGLTFIVFGGLHGIALVYEISTKKIRKIWAKKIPKFIYNFLSAVLTFIYVSFAWIYFRSPDINSANLFVTNIFKGDFSMPFICDTNIVGNSVFVLLIGFLFDLYLKHTNQDLEYFGSKLTFSKLVVFISVVIILTTLFFSDSNNFIYFQF